MDIALFVLVIVAPIMGIIVFGLPLLMMAMVYGFPLDDSDD